MVEFGTVMLMISARCGIKEFGRASRVPLARITCQIATPPSYLPEETQSTLANATNNNTPAQDTQLVASIPTQPVSGQQAYSIRHQQSSDIINPCRAAPNGSPTQTTSKTDQVI